MKRNYHHTVYAKPANPKTEMHQKKWKHPLCE